MHSTINTTEIFLVAMGIILTLPFLIWRVFGIERFAPLVVVQIVMGIVLGPGILGACFRTTTASSSARR